MNSVVYNTKIATINFYNIQYSFTHEQFDLILNSKLNFKNINYNKYVSYTNSNNKIITILEFLYKLKTNNHIYIFKDNNPYNLKYDNVLIYHKKHNDIIKKYNNAVYFQGHYKNNGNDAYNIKNPYWKINEDDNDENNQEYYLMYCDPDTFLKLDEKSLNAIFEYEKFNNFSNKITFYKHTNGYISSHCNNLYIHQIIMNLHGQGKGTNNLSVDHINRDPLDNRSTNLTIASLKEQQENSKGVLKDTKRERKLSAQELPENIKHEDIPKYCYYCKEKYNSNGDIRDFFRIEKHPNQKSLISTSKQLDFM